MISFNQTDGHITHTDVAHQPRYLRGITVERGDTESNGGTSGDVPPNVPARSSSVPADVPVTGRQVWILRELRKGAPLRVFLPRPASFRRGGGMGFRHRQVATFVEDDERLPPHNESASLPSPPVGHNAVSQSGLPVMARCARARLLFLFCGGTGAERDRPALPPSGPRGRTQSGSCSYGLPTYWLP